MKISAREQSSGVSASLVLHYKDCLGYSASELEKIRREAEEFKQEDLLEIEQIKQCEIKESEQIGERDLLNKEKDEYWMEATRDRSVSRKSYALRRLINEEHI